MPCKIIRDDAGNVVMIACSRGQRPKPCYYCSRTAAYLCDFKLTDGTTCDRALCGSCVVHVAEGVDHCRCHPAPAPPAEPDNDAGKEDTPTAP